MRRRAAGFTLLEVMIALAILGAALVVLLRISTGDVRASHRAKLLTIATGLARGKMLDIEEDLKRNGFQDTTQEQDGDFSDEGQAKFTWHALIEKLELPEAAQLAEGLETASGKPAGSTPPPSPEDEKNQEQLMGLAGGNMTGALGAGLVQMYFPLIKPVLEQAIRKVTLVVSWKIGGDSEELKVTAFYTDTKAIDAVLTPGVNAASPTGAAPSTRNPAAGTDTRPVGGTGRPTP